MAGVVLKYANSANPRLCEFAVDTIEDLNDLPTTTKVGTGRFAGNPEFDQTIPVGSTCIVGNEGGALLTFMLFSFGWKEL